MVRHWKKMPLCIKILAVYSIVLAVFYLILALSVDRTFLIGFEFTGPIAHIINLFSFMVVALIAYGFLWKRPFVYNLSLFWYSITILNFLVTTFFSGNSLLEVVGGSMKIFFIFGLIINAVTIWYIVSKKRYLLHQGVHEANRHAKWEASDRIFLYCMSLFFFLILIMFTAITIKFYTKTTKDIDSYLVQFQGLSAQDGYAYCLGGEVHNKDLCLTTLAVVKSSPSMKPVCKRISSSFYRFTCNYAIDSAAENTGVPP